MDPIIWIIIGVVAVVVVIALIALAARNNNKRKLTEAAELRRDARERHEQLERQHSVAREHEHRAGAAEHEAEAKAAEADRLRAEADQHRSVVDEQRDDVRRMEQHAEKLDPRHRAEDQGRHGEHGRIGEHGRHGEHRVTEGDTSRHGGTDGVTGQGDDLKSGSAGMTGAAAGGVGGRHSRAEESSDLDSRGVGDLPGDGASRESTDPAAHPHEDPGMVDKMLGRNRRDEPGH